MRTFTRDPYLCAADCVKVDRDCVVQCDGCRRLSMGLHPIEEKPRYNTNYPVPAVCYIAEHRYDPHGEECEILIWRKRSPNSWWLVREYPQYTN